MEPKELNQETKNGKKNQEEVKCNCKGKTWSSTRKLCTTSMVILDPFQDISRQDILDFHVMK